MSYDYLNIAATPSVRAAQAANGSSEYWNQFSGKRESNRLTEAEVGFIAERDSFYLATVSESGWPYVQHRGGPPGFLRVIDDRTLAFADFRGNRQYISLGNLAHNDRASLILVDYPSRTRLKIYARIEARDPGGDPHLAQAVIVAGYKAKPERVFVLRVEAFDWNCPQHITRRFSEAEIEITLAPMRQRIQELENEKTALQKEIERLHGSRGSSAPILG